MKTSGLFALMIAFGTHSEPATQSVSTKKVLDHSVYDSWKSIRGTTLSNDGNWVAYAIAAQEGDMVLEVQNTRTGAKKSYPIGQSLTLPQGTPVQPRISISNDSRYLVATVQPKYEEYKKARKDKVKPDDAPKNSLLVVDLVAGTEWTAPKLVSWQLAREDAGWLLYRVEPPKPEPAKAPAAAPATGAPASTAPATMPTAEAKPAPAKATEPKPAESKEPKKKADHRPGDTYMLRKLSDGKEIKLENVVSATFNKTGETLVLVTSDKDGKGDGVSLMNLATGAKTDIVKQLGRYPRVAVSDEGDRVALLTDKDDYAAKTPALSLYEYSVKSKKLNLVAKPDGAGLPKGWAPSAGGSLGYTESGVRLRFGIAPKPEAEPEVNADEAVSLDVWHWQDGVLQSQQVMQAGAERGRAYDVVYNVENGKSIQLESPEFPNAGLDTKRDLPYAVVTTNLPYRKSGSWGQNFADYYLLDLNSGEKRLVAKKTEAGLSLTPDGKFLIGYAEDSKELVSYDVKTLTRTVLNQKLPAIWDEKNDVPASPGLQGIAGFTADDSVLVYDSFDIWKVSLRGDKDPVNITGGWGRTLNVRYRRPNLDPEEQFVDLSKPQFLSQVDLFSMDSGFASLEKIKTKPRTIISEAKQFGASVTKAKKADTIVYTRQSFVEFPDLWVADNLEFKNGKKITEANPQQKDYNWGTVEFINYRSNDGADLRGLVYKPEDFSYTKKYPMIVYFYERDSEGIHGYRSPAPSASTINIPLFVSQGYVVLVTDIKYKVGYPGESAVGSILPATMEVLRRGYVDPKRVGIQGQSWGGYQVGYLVTETDMFAAGCAGAPVSNMISAYGGIRNESGVVRQGQYEQGQSRIGASIWEAPLRYFENSPILHADKVKTPLLIMSNDRDGAVPWQQGIEYFTALRRLEKPAWMLNYNGEAHNLVERRNRKDFSIRLSQFFDHYLKGAPMPVWMSEGIPAVKKGRTMGLELEKKKG